MKLVAILRIKDEILHIEKCLIRLEELVDEIIILDNGSTDGTLDVYPKFSKVVQILKTEGFNEGRDKIMLLEAAKQHNPDWIMWLDGDELLEPALTRKILDKYMSSKYKQVAFRMNHFWLSKRKFRIDGKFYAYTLTPMPRMWKNTPGSYFSDKKIHNGCIRGVDGKIKTSLYRILHYGYIDYEKVRTKVNLYEEQDKGGSRTYEHIRTEASNICLPLIGFSNRHINYIYLMFYDFICNILFFLLRVYRRMLSVLK
jgi:glycosyltransferase involved in cell wall biosynthesis